MSLLCPKLCPNVQEGIGIRGSYDMQERAQNLGLEPITTSSNHEGNALNRSAKPLCVGSNPTAASKILTFGTQCRGILR
jgi:hypothetical protein